MPGGYAYKKGIISIPQCTSYYAQHLGSDSSTLPDGTTTTKYALLRKLLPSDNYESDNYKTAQATSSTPSVLIDQRFYWTENLIGSLYLSGDFYAACKVGAIGDGSKKTYISAIRFDVESLNSAGIYTTIATNTVTFSTPYSVSANTYSIIDVHALLSGTAQEFSVSCVMCLRIRITGYLETGGTSQYIRLYYTKAQEDTYLNFLRIRAPTLVHHYSSPY